MKILRYAEHDVTIGDTLAVVKALRTGDLASGAVVSQFQGAVARYLGGNIQVVACSSGTAALHLAMLAAGIGKGDIVITSPNSFVASANCAKYVGAEVGFVDIDFATGCINIEKLIEICRSTSVKAVVVVDFAGAVAQLHKLRQNIRPEIVIIEDACHSFGGTFTDLHMPSKDPLTVKVGGAPWADMTVFSFHASKAMTTGEGGMVTTTSRTYADVLRKMRTHGMKDNTMTMLGYNYRMTDIQAALGLSQFKRLPEIQKHRAGIVEYYRQGLKGLPLVEFIQPYAPKDRQTLCWHLACVRIAWEAYNTTRESVQRTLFGAGIHTQVHYKPIPLQPVYGWSVDEVKKLWPNAYKHWQQALALPLHSRMGIKDAERVIYKLRKALGL